jgi:hypothetical protein
LIVEIKQLPEISVFPFFHDAWKSVKKLKPITSELWSEILSATIFEIEEISHEFSKQEIDP